MIYDCVSHENHQGVHYARKLRTVEEVNVFCEPQGLPTHV